MKTKRIVTISIATAFLLIVLFACVSLFSVRKAEVNFGVLEFTNTEEVQAVADGYLGENLMFLDKEEVKASFSSYNYLEVVSVEKKFPNVLRITLKERREIYTLENNGVYYVTNEDGFVLAEKSAEEINSDNRNVIKLSLDGVNVTDMSVGSVIKTDNDELMKTVFEMAKSARLTDCIKQITVKKLASSEPADVEFTTYTGVTICVEKAETDGVEKIAAAFDVYDNKISDYEKAFDVLYVFRNSQTGQIQVTWSDKTVVGS